MIAQGGLGQRVLGTGRVQLRGGQLPLLAALNAVGLRQRTALDQRQRAPLGVLRQLQR